MLGPGLSPNIVQNQIEGERDSYHWLQVDHFRVWDRAGENVVGVDCLPCCRFAALLDGDWARASGAGDLLIIRPARLGGDRVLLDPTVAAARGELGVGVDDPLLLVFLLDDLGLLVVGGEASKPMAMAAKGFAWETLAISFS